MSCGGSSLRQGARCWTIRVARRRVGSVLSRCSASACVQVQTQVAGEARATAGRGLGRARQHHLLRRLRPLRLRRPLAALPFDEQR